MKRRVLSRLIIFSLSMCCKREENWLKSVTGIHVIEGKLQWVFKSRIFIFKTSNFLVQSITVNFIPPPKKKQFLAILGLQSPFPGQTVQNMNRWRLHRPLNIFFLESPMLVDNIIITTFWYDIVVLYVHPTYSNYNNIKGKVLPIHVSGLSLRFIKIVRCIIYFVLD